MPSISSGKIKYKKHSQTSTRTRPALQNSGSADDTDRAEGQLIARQTTTRTAYRTPASGSLDGRTRTLTPGKTGGAHEVHRPAAKVLDGARSGQQQRRQSSPWVKGEASASVYGAGDDEGRCLGVRCAVRCSLEEQAGRGPSRWGKGRRED